MRFTNLKYASLPLALLLAGCFGNEPDADDILAAVRANSTIRRVLVMNAPGVNVRDTASVDVAAIRALSDAKVEKLGCAQPPAGMTGMTCEFRVGLKQGNGQFRFEKHRARFLKMNGNWQIAS
jgi:hypothetical protein